MEFARSVTSAGISLWLQVVSLSAEDAVWRFMNLVFFVKKCIQVFHCVLTGRVSVVGLRLGIRIGRTGKFPCGFVRRFSLE
jgi:hypothetical protein